MKIPKPYRGGRFYFAVYQGRQVLQWLPDNYALQMMALGSSRGYEVSLFRRSLCSAVALIKRCIRRNP